MAAFPALAVHLWLALVAMHCAFEGSQLGSGWNWHKAMVLSKAVEIIR
jgi:hypothetical protein